MMGKMRQVARWRGNTLIVVDAARRVVAKLRDFWPLTLRQIYYQLVASLVIPNNRNSYGNLSKYLTKARLQGLIPWEAMEDRSRAHLVSGGWKTAGHFAKEQLDEFLNGYRRDLLQGQPHRLELWIEKDALAHMAHNVAFDYCVPVIVAKGFSSTTYKNEARKRIVRADRAGQRTKILYFGDLDPSGWAMLPSVIETLRDEMSVGSRVEGVRCALTPGQALDMQLPYDPEAMKEKDSRTPGYRAMLRSDGYPDDMAVELDAIPPDVLQGLIQQAIEDNLDVSQFEAQRQAEADDTQLLGRVRDRCVAAFEQIAGDEGLDLLAEDDSDD